MKRIITFALALLIVLSFAACGEKGGDTKKDDGAKSTPAASTPKSTQKPDDKKDDKKDDKEAASELQYTLLEDGSGYSVKGAESSSETSVVIEASYKGKPVVEIAEDAFDGYRKMTEISIPDSVLRIDGYAFHWCEALTQITVPSSVQSIGRGAFRYSSLKSFIFPEGITVIDEDVFYGVQTLEYVVIPASVTLIKDAAFDDTRAMTAVYFGGTQAQWDAITFENKYDFYLRDAKKYFYSDSAPSGEGDFWHYVDGVPTPW